MVKIYFLNFILFLVPTFAQAQQGIKRTYTPYNHLWTGVEFEQKISKKIRAGIDVPYRRQNLEKGSLKIYENLHWAGFRLWATILLTDQIYLNISPLAYFYEVPPTNKEEGLDEWQDEIRFSIRLRYAPENSIISHRYALERRYRRDHEKNHWQEYRVRYMLRLNKEIFQDYRLIVDDEIFINMGKDIGYNIFDMNRFFLGIRKAAFSDIKLTAGYQNILDQLSSGDAYNVIHAFTFTISIRSTLND